MRKIFIFLAALLLCVAILTGKNLITKVTLERMIYSVSGLKLSIERVKTGLFKPFIRLENLILMNPAGFPEGIMFDVPLLYVEYDVRSLFDRRLHIKDMEFHLKELNVIKNRNGRLNLNSLNMIKDYASPGFRVKVKPTVIIDRLHLRGGSVTYRDMTGSLTHVKKFTVVVDEVYMDIKDPYTAGRLIVANALRKTDIARLSGFDLGLLQEGLENIAMRSTKIVNDTAKGAMEFSQKFTRDADSILRRLKSMFTGGRQ